MNNRLKGSLRDKEITREVERLTCLNTEQVYSLFFRHYPNPATGYRKAQERLQVLTQKKKLLKRWRPSIDDCYVYYTEKRQAQYEHRVAINWIYVWFKQNKLLGDLKKFDTHQNYGILECDAFAMTLTREGYRFYFVEVEVDNHSPFDKVQKYVQLYESEKYTDWWWVKHASGFPTILVACENDRRKQEVEANIKKYNSCGLDFRVYGLDHIRTGCTRRPGR